MVTAVAHRLAKQQKMRDASLSTFKLSEKQQLEVKSRMKLEMERGLKKETHSIATVKMLATYVRATPDGTGTQFEKPEFYNGQVYCLQDLTKVQYFPIFPWTVIVIIGITSVYLFRKVYRLNGLVCVG